MKKSGAVWVAVALLLGGGGGYYLSQHIKLDGNTQTAADTQSPTGKFDPYGQLGSGNKRDRPQAQLPKSQTSSPTPTREAPPAPTNETHIPKPQAREVPKPGAPALPADFKLTLRPEAPLGPLPSSPRPQNPDSWYALGKTLGQAGHHRRAAAAFAQAAALNPSAANWRALADEYVALKRYAAATHAYGQAVNRYRQGGDEQTARAIEHLAAPYSQQAEFYLLTPKTAPTQPQLAKFEPPRGVLLGVHVAGDGVAGAWGQRAHLTAQYQPFAVAFRYWQLSRSDDPAMIFPGRFAGAARAGGQALHLALEPGMPLGQISDTVIRRFAAEARAADLPIFVRFASEMNDPHNDWSHDPALYRRTFKRVADILHHDAPNVALVWMPMPGDLDKIAAYYPGPEAVDWAGLSLYSVPFENGDIHKPRLSAHPLDVIDGFYRQYAPRHPIQLSEYAASHHSGAAPDKDFSAFAAQQLRETYWGAWMKYPRLKNINWLDIDMHTDPLVRRGQQQRENDYRLFGSPAKWKAFGELRAEPAFFRSFAASQCTTCAINAALPWPTHLTSAQAAGGVSGELWLQTAQPAATVKLLLNNRALPEAGYQLPYRFRLPALAAGRHLLTVRVLDGSGQLLLEENRLFVAQ